MEVDFHGTVWIWPSGFDRPSEWIDEKRMIKDGVKREVGVDGVEVEERMEGSIKSNLRFTHGSASCLLVLH